MKRLDIALSTRLGTSNSNLSVVFWLQGPKRGCFRGERRKRPSFDASTRPNHSQVSKIIINNQSSDKQIAPGFYR